MSDNTAVAEKDLPELMMPTYENAPEDVDSAIQRILHVEMLLEDLSRAVEIAQISGQWAMVDGFRSTADEYLRGKIQIKQPDQGDLKITIITDEETK